MCAYKQEVPQLGSRDLADAQEKAVPRHESLAVDSLLTGAPWTQIKVIRLPFSDHINVKETSVLARTISEDARRLAGNRKLYIADSRVGACVISPRMSSFRQLAW